MVSQKRSFHQDRLGTGIKNTPTKEAFSAGLNIMDARYVLRIMFDLCQPEVPKTALKTRRGSN